MLKETKRVYLINFAIFVCRTQYLYVVYYKFIMYSPPTLRLLLTYSSLSLSSILTITIIHVLGVGLLCVNYSNCPNSSTQPTLFCSVGSITHILSFITAISIELEAIFAILLLIRLWSIDIFCAVKSWSRFGQVGRFLWLEPNLSFWD